MYSWYSESKNIVKPSVFTIWRSFLLFHFAVDTKKVGTLTELIAAGVIVVDNDIVVTLVV